MTAQEARAAAERWIAGAEMGGFTARFADATKSESASDEWVVVFDMYEPEGGLDDHPMVIVVNERTQAVYPRPSCM
jgi:hypothetical protein